MGWQGNQQWYFRYNVNYASLFSSYHYGYWSTMELFYSKVTVHNSLCFNIKQYLRCSWGNVILEHAQSQGSRWWSISVSVRAALSDVSFPSFSFQCRIQPALISSSTLGLLSQQSDVRAWGRCPSPSPSPASFPAADQPKGTTTSPCFIPVCTQITGSGSQGF